MTITKAVALAWSAMFVPVLAAQSPESRPLERRILMLEGTRPALDDLRSAIRNHDAASASDAGSALASSVVTARADLARAVAEAGGAIVEHYWIVDGCVVEVPRDAVAALASLPHVVSVWEDAARSPGEFTVPIKRSTNASNHGTDSVQARGIRGAGVTIAVVDSGLDSSVAGAPRPHRTFFVNGDPNNTTGGGIAGSRVLANVQVGAYPADDPIDHGTRVGAVAAGATWNTTAGSDDGHAPDAKLVGYAMVDLSNGFASVSTIVRAWQRCALEAAQYGTKVAVCSYDGFWDALAPDMQAVDACADVADLTIAVMAGNSATNSLFYAGATNVLAVGSVQHDSHAASTFSARGPLARTSSVSTLYPSLVANGEAIEMPTANNEAANVVRNGTSYAAPQVAGAAALFRSIATTATADTTRAAILATVDSAAGQNQATMDQLGNGYLRVDRLVDLAQGNVNGVLAAGRVTVVNPVWTRSFPANRGEVYAVAIAFARRIVAATTWANLDVVVSQGGVVLAQSTGVADAAERVVFSVPANGSVDIQVVARTFELGTVDQEFGVAAALASVPLLSRYGNGCPGERSPSTVREIEPMFLAGFGNGSSDQLIGGLPHRTQQWIETNSPSAAFSVRALALRHDDAAPAGSWNRSWVELEATFDLSMSAATTMVPTFAQNLGRLQTQVIARKTFVLPSLPNPNTDPNRFAIVLPLDFGFERQYDPLGPNPGSVMDLVVDVRTYATSAGAQPLQYPLDAVAGNASVRTLFAPSPTATTGTFSNSTATVIGLVGSGLGTQRVPTLDALGMPAIGGQYGLVVGSAPASIPVFVATGLSQTAIGGLPLPLDLTGLGAPGCFLLSSLDLLVTAATNVQGTATVQVAVPNNPALRGRSVFHQALVNDPGASALGLTTTSALRATFGF